MEEKMTDEPKQEMETQNEVNRPMTEEEKKAAAARAKRFIDTHRKTLEKLAK